MEYQQSDLLEWLRNRAILHARRHRRHLEESEATSRQLRHAAATIERLENELNFWHRKWQRDYEALNDARAEVERLKSELLEARRDCMGDLEKRYQWGML